MIYLTITRFASPLPYPPNALIIRYKKSVAQWKFSGDKRKFWIVCKGRTSHQRFP